MRNITTAIITAALATTLCAVPALASAKASKEESIGVGSGGAIGALAGGPVGFIVGAAIGAKIGDTFHRKDEQLDDLQASLIESRNSTASLENDIDRLGREIGRLSDLARPELVDLMQAGINMDLLFRTDEFALTDTTGDRLARLATSLASMPDIRVQLDGFADERGDEQYNFELSEKRVGFVRELFESSGVHPERISVKAHGESVAQDATSDSFALERRVSVRLFIDATPSLAANP